jgi:preprotein translocase subunit SecD
MKKSYRLLIILAVIGVGLYFLWPSLQWYFLTPQADKDIAESSRNNIKIYSQEKADEIVTKLTALSPDSVLPAEYSYLIPDAQARYVEAKLPMPATWHARDILSAYSGRADIALDVETYYRTRFQALKELRNRTLQLGLDLRGGMYVVLQADFAALEKTVGKTFTDTEKQDKMTGALEALRNRIDQYGLTEPQIRQQGTGQIVIELPGTQDPERVRSFIQGKGVLTFHLVDQDGLKAVQDYVAQHPGVVLFDAAGNVKDPGALAVLPKGDELLGVYQKDVYGLDDLKGYAVVKSEVGLNGSEIQSAQPAKDPVTGETEVIFSLSSQGGETFYKLTSANVGKLLCVVLDNKIKSNPATIQTAIRDQVRVTGIDVTEATDLALTLRTGSLPVGLEVLSQQAIGASLGQDAINQGIKASVLGIGLVMLFMLAFYRRAGLNAVISQLLHLYINVAVLSVFNFTLTLSAIAGLVLTIGMAVDANVLIFERMKEESRLGKTTQAVVDHGFSRAFSAILDSNVTTIITAIVLSQLAKGSVQGFAVTLLIGNLATLFAAVFVSRLIFDFNVDVLKVRKILISWRKLA